MYRPALPFVFIALLTPAAAGAAPGGLLDTIPYGQYRCELPGDATGPSRRPVPEEDFAIINGSSYATAHGEGSYLLTGDDLVMTSGPKRSDRFHRLDDNFLRKVDEKGKDGPLRCVRSTRNSG